jgi:hypothetical protein
MKPEIEFVVRRASSWEWIGILLVDGKEIYRNGKYTATPDFALIRTLQWARAHGYDI